MKALIEVKPTPEQLALFSRIRAGTEIIRGAAGSGKTTTALLKLRAAVGFYVNRMKRQAHKRQIKVLVLTFNRTLRGYVKELAEQQFEQSADISLEISTFSGWSSALLGNPSVIENGEMQAKLAELGSNLPLKSEFIVDEVGYALGKFLPGNLSEYLTVRREGRGSTPRMERPLRESLLSDVILPYGEYKKKNKTSDWNDLAVKLADTKKLEYDVVVVDETQDFSANELRAVMRQLAGEHTATFVLDTAQRIYARSGFTWQEVGLTVRPENSHRLTINYRNTKQIARFAAGILEGIVTDADGSMPNFDTAVREGAPPLVVEGKFSRQLDFALRYIKKTVDLRSESVAFLHARGGGWFKDIKQGLKDAGLPYVEISRRADWPEGDENIALSTLHSAKGLEFDFVFILGLNAEVIPIAEAEAGDEHEPMMRLRRLVAMGVGRARKGVIVGYKGTDAPAVAKFFKAGTFEGLKQ